MKEHRQDEGTLQVTPEDIVNDYLIGRYELEKLRNGFQAPFGAGQPCDQHKHLANDSEA